MWAINDMFGTGTTGFTVITTVLAVGTYVVVFSLLHQNTQRQAVESMKQAFRLLWPNFLVSGKGPKVNTLQDEGQAQGTARRGSQKETGEGGQWKMNLRPRFSREKSKSHDDEVGVSCLC
jgi:hypothetical protein